MQKLTLVKLFKPSSTNALLKSNVSSSSAFWRSFLLEHQKYAVDQRALTKSNTERIALLKLLWPFRHRFFICIHLHIKYFAAHVLVLCCVFHYHTVRSNSIRIAYYFCVWWPCACGVHLAILLPFIFCLKLWLLLYYLAGIISCAMFDLWVLLCNRFGQFT